MIKLKKFDKNFLKSIKDYKKIHIKSNEGTHYTIFKGDKKVGVIGFKIKENGKYFLKIGIHQDFRGQGIFKESLIALAKKHKIKRIYSTIAIANKSSIKAHKKIGFKHLSKIKENKLKKEGLLLKRNTRLIKNF